MKHHRFNENKHVSLGELCNKLYLMTSSNKYLSNVTYCDQWCRNETTRRDFCCGFIKTPSLGLSRGSLMSVLKLGKDKIGIKHNGKFLTANSDGIANFDAPSPYEDGIFYVEKYSRNQIALKSIYNKYLTSKSSGCLTFPTFSSSVKDSTEIWKVKCAKENGK